MVVIKRVMTIYSRRGAPPRNLLQASCCCCNLSQAADFALAAISWKLVDYIGRGMMKWHFHRSRYYR